MTNAVRLFLSITMLTLLVACGDTSGSVSPIVSTPPSSPASGAPLPITALATKPAVTTIAAPPTNTASVGNQPLPTTPTVSAPTAEPLFTSPPMPIRQTASAQVLATFAAPEALPQPSATLIPQSPDAPTPLPIAFAPTDPIIVMPAERTGDLSITLAISPAKTGEDIFTVRLDTADGQPSIDAQVHIMITMLTMNMGVENLVLKPVPAQPGFFRSGGEFGMGGDWQIAVSVQRPGKPEAQAIFRVTAPYGP